MSIANCGDGGWGDAGCYEISDFGVIYKMSKLLHSLIHQEFPSGMLLIPSASLKKAAIEVQAGNILWNACALEMYSDVCLTFLDTLNKVSENGSI